MAGARFATALQAGAARWRESYLGPVGTVGFRVTGDTQILQAGARRLAFLTLGTTF